MEPARLLRSCKPGMQAWMDCGTRSPGPGSYKLWTLVLLWVKDKKWKIAIKMHITFKDFVFWPFFFLCLSGFISQQLWLVERVGVQSKCCQEVGRGQGWAPSSPGTHLVGVNLEFERMMLHSNTAMSLEVWFVLENKRRECINSGKIWNPAVVQEGDLVRHIIYAITFVLSQLFQGHIDLTQNI